MHGGADAAMGPHVQRAAEDLHPAIVLALFKVGSTMGKERKRGKGRRGDLLYYRLAVYCT